jgi:hypothetical protein
MAGVTGRHAIVPHGRSLIGFDLLVLSRESQSLGGLRTVFRKHETPNGLRVSIVTPKRSGLVYPDIGGQPIGESTIRIRRITLIKEWL